MTKTLNKSDLAAIHGQRELVSPRHQPRRAFYGRRQIRRRTGGAYWLLDEIAIIQPHDARVATEEFQVWKLAVNADQTGVLTCDDGNGRVVFSKALEYTDFPQNGVTLYFTNNTILLPGEY